MVVKHLLDAILPNIMQNSWRSGLITEVCLQSWGFATKYSRDTSVGLSARLSINIHSMVEVDAEIGGLWESYLEAADFDIAHGQ